MRNPYVTGAYVTGTQHYGREQLIETLLRGGSRAYWVVGNRRTGRTSLLRQLQLLTGRRGRLVPLYIDLQGCTTSLDLGRYLAEAVRDQFATFEKLGLPKSLVDEEDVLTLLTHLRRLVGRSQRDLLLLCDEGEALVDLARDERDFIQRLHRELTLGAGIRTVVTSTGYAYGLHDAPGGKASPPFLNGFDMSLTFGGLSAAAARGLILQTQAPRGSRVKAAATIVTAIRIAANGHPFLLQWLCNRLLQENGVLRAPNAEDLHGDESVSSLFENDWSLLTASDRRILLAASEAERAGPGELGKAIGEDASGSSVRLTRLEDQGYLRKLKVNYEVGNPFLARWLTAEAPRLTAAPAAATSEAALQTVLFRQRDHDVDALAAQLNARRRRLVDLELVRATEFQHAPTQVLAEIAQLETEIAALRSLVVRRASA